ncbi:MAG: hypothetical protein E6H01_01765 [Bacillati bacterium ANGP1]|uniref:SPOR domain-containing protein n=1 Tax=Candidatus Segetimicrobium genomatis TaxID=2569760 RepID=A0A537LEN4_9BACT|nr:MAG: hypothetical protein E6H01_01765 [Terrabacteria group bacterium ANGP1]
MRPTVCSSPGGRGMNAEGSESHVLAEVLSRVRRRVLKTELGGATVNERSKTASGKKFSITIQVPDDVAAQWPDRSTAERLIEEIFRAMSGASSASSGRPSSPRARTPVVVLFLAALFAAGLIAGYLGARAYTVFSSPGDRPATAAALRPDPASTPQATTSQAGPQPAADLSASSTPAAEPQPAPATVSPEVAARTIVAPAVVYHVQIGAFRLRENADTLIQLLDRDGFKANVLQSGKLYIVYLGTFADQKDAARLANALRNHHYDVVVIQGQAQAAKN